MYEMYILSFVCKLGKLTAGMHLQKIILRLLVRTYTIFNRVKNGSNGSKWKTNTCKWNITPLMIIKKVILCSL